MKKAGRVLSLTIALLMCLAMVLAACSQVTVTISRTTASVAVGETVTLTATASDGSDITWSSDNTAVATVDKGVVTGVTVGTAVITAASDRARATCTVTVTETPAAYSGYLSDFSHYLAYTKYDLQLTYNSIGKISTAIDAKVDAAYQAGVAAIDSAKSVSAARKALSDAKTAIANCIPLANGMKSYTAASVAEKTAIMGKLESYAVSNGITGITLFENGGYQIFNNRVVLGTENYILGYGFGTLSEGSLSGPLATEQNNAWKMYYHSLQQEDPGTINALDNDGSVISDLYALIAGSYYGTYMNSTKDGYEWFPVMASADPEPVGGLDENGQASKWRFEIKQGLKYDTLGKHTDYKGREIALEDYLTPYKLMFNQANGLFRGTEAAGQTGAKSIKGAKAYFDATKNSNKGIATDVDFSSVGVKVYENGGKWYFEYELGAPTTLYYARYYIGGDLYAPIPASFIEAVGGIDNYLGYNSDKTDTPVDNSLSTGPYTLERWDSGQQIVLKKNPYFADAETKYKIEGIHYNVLEAMKTNDEAAFDEWKAGKIDACGIPEKYIKEYGTHPNTKTTSGTMTTKLNFNALDAKTWEYMFGTEGVVTQHSKDQYWDVKPIMSNSHFLRGLSFATNREEFAVSKGLVASASFLSPNYLNDPEKGQSYNATSAHKSALASIINENTDEYGYSLELARDYFRMALDELEADGAYTPGTKENPTVIKLRCMWYLPVFEEPYFKPLKQYWESAFNDDSVSGGKYRLELEFYAPANPDIAYDMMKSGDFDIGYGSIYGNYHDVIDFLSILSSTPMVAQGWTLNWGADTSKASSDILVYDGVRWSYDALQQAGVTTVLVQGGELGETIGEGTIVATPATDKIDVTITIPYNTSVGVKATVTDLVLFAEGSDYDKWSIKNTANMNVVDDGNGKLTITASVLASELAKIEAVHSRLGLDVYLSYTAGGLGGEKIVTVMLDNVVEEESFEATESEDGKSVTLTMKIACNDLAVDAAVSDVLLMYLETGEDKEIVRNSIKDGSNVTVVNDGNGTITVTVVLSETDLAAIPDDLEALALGVKVDYTLLGQAMSGSISEEFDKPVAPVE